MWRVLEIVWPVLGVLKTGKAARAVSPTRCSDRHGEATGTANALDIIQAAEKAARVLPPPPQPNAIKVEESY